MVANLVILKLIAMFVGPSGLGVLGNFMSLTTMASVFAGGGIGNGIAKYVAQYQKRPIRRIRFLGSAMTYGTVVSLMIMAATVFAARPLAIRILANPDQVWLMPCFGVAQFLCFIGTASIAVANGERRTDLFAKISISAYLIAIPIAYFLVAFFNMAGAGVALLVTISCTALPSLYYIATSRACRALRFRASKDDLINLGRFSLMLMASALFFPSAEIFIRNQISAHLGYESAGIWQALNRLSGAYLGFFTIFLSTHYMPRLSAMTSKHELVGEVRKYIVGVGGSFFFFAVVLYTFRDLVVELLFSSSFSEMRDLLPLQMFGNFFRLMSYVIGFLGVAKAALRLYIVAELLQTSIYTFFSWLALRDGGRLDNVVHGYIWTYMLYFSVTLVCFHIYSKRRL